MDMFDGFSSLPKALVQLEIYGVIGVFSELLSYLASPLPTSTMASEHPKLTLILYTSLQDANAVRATAIWNPGVSLRGLLRLTSKNKVGISEASVLFEGIYKFGNLF